MRIEINKNCTTRDHVRIDTLTVAPPSFPFMITKYYKKESHFNLQIFFDLFYLKCYCMIGDSTVIPSSSHSDYNVDNVKCTQRVKRYQSKPTHIPLEALELILGGIACKHSQAGRFICKLERICLCISHSLVNTWRSSCCRCILIQLLWLGVQS